MGTSGNDEASLFFCEQCRNILYPITDGIHARELRWSCRACGNIEEHEAQLVYSLDLGRDSGGTRAMQELAMFAFDPTVPIDTTRPCRNCGKTGLAWFVNPMEQPVEDMSLYFACKHCKEVWKDEPTQP